MDTIEKLEHLSIHDSSVYDLVFNFWDNQIELKFEKSDHIQTLTFLKVVDINIQDASDFVLTEVYQLNCTKKDDLYEIEIVFVTEFSLPSWRLSFKCKEVKVE